MDNDVDVIDASGLYTVEPERFVAARDALVRRLRAAGEKTEAAQVAKMRRPPPSAWALNQVARTHPGLIERLGDAGAGLRSATERAVGGDASSLRAARSAERGAVDAIVDRAADLLQRGGRPASEVVRQRMAATLRAAVVDDSIADALRHGTLTADHDAPGFGMEALSLASLPTVPAEEEVAGQKEAPQTPVGDEAPGRTAEAAKTAAAEAPRSKATKVEDPAKAARAAADPAEAARADAAPAEATRAEADRALQEARAKADRLAESAEALSAEADRLSQVADQLMSEAQKAAGAAQAARDRADAVAQAAAEARSDASRLAATTD
ncbi:MAG TPA: hypothetical protein VHT30_03735 [Acidimicrobiales bacterium]|jgi:hypothetical protein|nr:hypothetical protein [Acidimicrobiales bacterium]